MYQVEHWTIFSGGISIFFTNRKSLEKPYRSISPKPKYSHSNLGKQSPKPLACERGATSGVGDQRAPARYTMGIRQNSHDDLTPDRREESAVKSGDITSGSRSRDYEWFISGVGDGRDRGRTTSSPKIRRIRMVIWWGWMGDSKDLQLLPPIGFRSAVGLLADSPFFTFFFLSFLTATSIPIPVKDPDIKLWIRPTSMRCR